MKKSLITILVVSLLVLSVSIWRKTSAFEYSTYTSPDGRFVVRVMEYPRILGHFPGDSGGGNGYVELIDAQTMRVVESRRTDLVMTIETVRWQPDVVDIKLFVTWPLPKE